MHIHMCAHSYAHTHTHTRVHMHTHIHTCTRTCTRVHTQCTHVCTLNAHTCTLTHTHAHTRTGTRTHVWHSHTHRPHSSPTQSSRAQAGPWHFSCVAWSQMTGRVRGEVRAAGPEHTGRREPLSRDFRAPALEGEAPASAVSLRSGAPHTGPPRPCPAREGRGAKSTTWALPSAGCARRHRWGGGRAHAAGLRAHPGWAMG